MNKITIVGRLGQDPQVRQVKDNRVTTFSFAETSTRKDQDGNYITNWYNCTAWGKLGENCAKWLHQGDGATIVGDLLLRKYKDKQNIERMSVDVTVSDLAFGQKKNDTPIPTTPANGNDDDLPF